MNKRDLIRKHIGNWSGLEKSSIQSFADTGKVSGSFLIALENMMEEYHLSKLHQPTVISAVCEHEWKADTFDCYGNAISMYCDECGAKQTDL